MNRTIQMLTYNWAVSTFGEVATDPKERAARLLEEAAEVAQSLGVGGDVAARIVERTYGRPVGQPWQEIGGTLVCIVSLCHRLGLDAESLLYDELLRVTSRPREYWTKKHDEKVKDGTANVGKL